MMMGFGESSLSKEESMKKFFFLFLLLSVLLVPASGCYAKGPWKGKVIDAETKQPIEGAAVVAHWNYETLGPTGGGTNFLDAKETVTDKNGEFEIPSRWFVSIPLIRRVTGPWFTIFKPGYGTFPKFQIEPKLTPAYLFEGKGATVLLPKTITREERLNSLDEVEFNLDYLRKFKLKNILRLINIEHKELGLQQYEEEKIK
jgi:hypothetical protein